MIHPPPPPLSVTRGPAILRPLKPVEWRRQRGAARAPRVSRLALFGDHVFLPRSLHGRLMEPAPRRAPGGVGGGGGGYSSRILGGVY